MAQPLHGELDSGAVKAVETIATVGFEAIALVGSFFSWCSSQAGLVRGVPLISSRGLQLCATH